MAIRFQFAGDKSIGVGSRPPGAFSLFKPPGAAFPPAGSYNSTQYGVDYPIAEGGSAVQDPETLNSYPSQICDVDVLNDGSGGTYIYWLSATNVQYKAYGISFYTSTSPSNSDIEVPSGSGNYYTAGSAYADYKHDGSGGYFQDWVNQTWYSNGTDTNIELLNGGNNQTEVPTGSGNYYDNGTFEGYTWDGIGGYNYPVGKGNYFAADTHDNISVLDVINQTEVPTGSTNYYDNGTSTGYTWDGSGGYNYPVIKGNYYSAGDDTNLTGLDVPFQSEVPTGSGNYYNDGRTEGYTWDGSGGYNYPVTKGNFYANGILINNIPTGNTSGSVEVPVGSSTYYDSEYEVTPYYWDGSGGYTSGSNFNQFYDYGTFIYNDGTYDYFWDGTGGYYS